MKVSAPQLNIEDFHCDLGTNPDPVDCYIIQANYDVSDVALQKLRELPWVTEVNRCRRRRSRRFQVLVRCNELPSKLADNRLSLLEAIHQAMGRV